MFCIDVDVSTTLTAAAAAAAVAGRCSWLGRSWLGRREHDERGQFGAQRALPWADIHVITLPGRTGLIT